MFALNLTSLTITSEIVKPIITKLPNLENKVVGKPTNLENQVIKTQTCIDCICFDFVNLVNLDLESENKSTKVGNVNFTYCRLTHLSTQFERRSSK